MWLAVFGPLAHAAGTLTWDGAWQPAFRKTNARQSTRTGGPDDDDEEAELVRKLLPIVTIIIMLIVIFDK